VRTRLKWRNALLRRVTERHHVTGLDQVGRRGGGRRLSRLKRRLCVRTEPGDRLLRETAVHDLADVQPACLRPGREEVLLLFLQAGYAQLAVGSTAWSQAVFSFTARSFTCAYLTLASMALVRATGSFFKKASL
jgi:hypothetical protein